METYTKFSDIPLYTSSGSWECDYQLDRVLVAIDEWCSKSGLNLNPDFQREHVWTEPQQIAFIEYVLRGGRNGLVIYLNCPTWHQRHKRGSYDEFVIVDGKQRVQALRRFMTDEIKIFGTLRKDYQDHPDLMRQRMKINVNDLQSRAEVLRWYLEMNSGGTPHTFEELERVRLLYSKEVELSRFPNVS